MELRPYQQEAVSRLKKSLISGNRRVVLALATGAGKSVIIREIVKMAAAKSSNVLMIAHRTILIDQMRKTLSNFDNVVIETVQASRNREHDDIKILIIDEFHYGVNSPMQDRVISKYKNVIVIGLSATPITAQGHKIDNVDEVIDIVQLKDLVDLGYAAPLKVLAPASIDRSGFKVTAGDYNKKDVSDEVTKSAIISNVVEQYVRHGHGLKTIFYAINIDHAELLETDLLIRGYNVATYHSKVKNKEQIFNDFKDGEIDILVSVESLTTGVDLPDIYCLVLAVPTKSIIKAVQIYGRACRLNPKDPNKKALILDCANVVDDTIHPYQRMTFNKNKEDTAKACFCGGKMKVIKRELSKPDETGLYTSTTTTKCDKCGRIAVDTEEKVAELTFCEKCENLIEKGTSQAVTEEEDGNIIVSSICPHCGNKKVFREIEAIDAELEEKMLNVNMQYVETWEDVKKQFHKAKDKHGKKYHHLWADRAINALIEEGFTIAEVSQTVSFYINKGWPIGGIPNVMKKRRDERGV